MGKLFSTFLIAILAYKLGEQNGQLMASDYLINRQYLDQNNNLVVDYVSINDGGVVEYVSRQDATTFDFWRAKQLRQILKTYSPQMPFQLEIINPAILN